MPSFPLRQSSFITDMRPSICHPEPRGLQHRREPPREGPMYFVYTMTKPSKTLNIGVTNNLLRMVREHKTGVGSEFTAKCKLHRLVYYERFEDVQNAIERGKSIKGWLRIKNNRACRLSQSIVEGFERGVVRASSIPAAECLLRDRQRARGFPVLRPHESQQVRCALARQSEKA